MLVYSQIEILLGGKTSPHSKYQKEAVAGTFLLTIQRLWWFAFSEMELQTRFCSEDREERKAGVQKIIELRSEDNATPVDLSEGVLEKHLQ